MTQLEFSAVPLAGSSRKQLDDWFKMTGFVFLMDSLKAKELELCLTVGRSTKVIGDGVMLQSSEGQSSLLELEKVRHTIELLERLSEQEAIHLTRQFTTST